MTKTQHLICNTLAALYLVKRWHFFPSESYREQQTSGARVWLGTQDPTCRPIDKMLARIQISQRRVDNKGILTYRTDEHKLHVVSKTRSSAGTDRLHVRCFVSLNIWLSLKIIQNSTNQMLPTVSYSQSTVTMVLSCIISQIKRSICQKSRFFMHHCIWRPYQEHPLEDCHKVWYKKTGMVWLADNEKVWRHV